MQLIKASFLTILFNVFRLLGSLVVNKIIALNLGPSALGVLGQIQSFTNSLITLGTGLTNQGIVKLISQNSKDPKALKEIIQTGYLYLLVGNVLLMLIVVLFKPIIIANLFGDIYSIDFLPLILYSLTIMCLNTLILNICLGFSNIKGYSWIHISWSIQNVLLNAYLIYQYQLKGAVYGFILNQSVVLFITLFFIRKYKWTKYLFTLPKYHKEWITPFFKYSLVYTMSFILVPFVYIFIRTQISNSLGWDEVGYWESINKLSFLYMYFISNIINVYFIPTYSKESLGTIKNNFYLHLVYCIGIFLCGAFLLYLLKKYIIVLIFSEEFLVIQDYIIYQLIGDFFRIISLFLSSIFIARARLKNQLMIEFFTILTFPVLVYFTLEDYKLYGVLGAYIFWYFIYDVLLFLYVRKIFKE